MTAAQAIGMPLPLGNGSCGPWYRIAMVREDGTYGQLDTASGRLAVTDAQVPTYVLRFALRTAEGVSPHPAGGAGGVQPGWSQIALTLTRAEERPVVSPLPRPKVVEIIHGLRTCYGTIGEPVSTDDWRREWAALAAVPQQATAAPQSEDYMPGPGIRMDATMAVDLLESTRRTLHPCASVTVIRGGVDYPGCPGEARFRLHGTAAQRTAAKEHLEVAYADYAERVQQRALIAARVAVGVATPSERDLARSARTSGMAAFALPAATRRER